MPLVENSDGTLWIDIREMSEVETIRGRLAELGLSVTAVVPDPASKVVLEEADWGDLYPRIVLRSGPEPGIIVAPGEIPPDHTLALAVNTIAGAPRMNMVTTLILIRGPAPPVFGKIITHSRPPTPSDPRLTPARPPQSGSHGGHTGLSRDLGGEPDA